MEFNQLSQDLLQTSTLSLLPLIINLIVGWVLAIFIKQHFKRYGSTLTNRDEFSQVFPMVLLTIILIISVVKSSLALALGLVGALSIVRFRTPIKEPEELAYIFWVIGAGLALGAGQTIAAIVATAVIYIIMMFVKSKRQGRPETGLFFSVQCPKTENTQEHSLLEQLNDLLSKHTQQFNLRRFDNSHEKLEALFYVNLQDEQALYALNKAIASNIQGATTSFLDQKNVAGY